MANLQKEIARRDALVDLMHKHGLKMYRRGEEVVEVLEGKTKVRVRTMSEDDAPEPGTD